MLYACCFHPRVFFLIFISVVVLAVFFIFSSLHFFVQVVRNLVQHYVDKVSLYIPECVDDLKKVCVCVCVCVCVRARVSVCM